MSKKNRSQKQATAEAETETAPEAEANTATATAEPEQDIPLEAYPEPKLPRGRSGGSMVGKTFIANPRLKGVNPRREGTHGYRFHEMVRAAGPEGISYEDLRAKAEADEDLVGFTNHLKWDLNRKFIVIKGEVGMSGEEAAAQAEETGADEGAE